MKFEEAKIEKVYLSSNEKQNSATYDKSSGPDEASCGRSSGCCFAQERIGGYWG